MGSLPSWTGCRTSCLHRYADGTQGGLPRGPHRHKIYDPHPGGRDRIRARRHQPEGLAAAKARGVIQHGPRYARIPNAKQEATKDRAEAVRPAIASTLRLSATAAADELNRRGITTVSGKRWQATQVIRARRRLSLTTTI